MAVGGVKEHQQVGAQAGGAAALRRQSLLVAGLRRGKIGSIRNAGIKKPPANPAGGQVQDIELKTRFAVETSLSGA